MQKRYVTALDFETASEASLNAVGGANYAAHGSTVPLLLSLGNKKYNVIIDFWGDKYEKRLDDYETALQILRDSDGITAHNRLFDQLIAEHALPSIKKHLNPIEYSYIDRIHAELKRLTWVCTADLARMAGLPAALDDIARVLGLGGKIKTGKFGISLFCCKGANGLKETIRANISQWKQFKVYCVKDTSLCLAVYDILRAFLAKSNYAFERAVQDLTFNMNTIGIPLDVNYVEQLSLIADDFFKDAEKECLGMVGLKPTQVQKIKTFLKQHIDIEDLRRDTLEDALSVDLPDNIRRLLEIRLEASMAAPRKLKAISSQHRNGRIYGALTYYGAATGRASSRGVQFHNLKHSNPDTTNMFVSLATDRVSSDTYKCFFDNPLDAMSSSMRAMIKVPKNRYLYNADYNAIEVRIGAYFCKQESILSAYCSHRDIYVEAAKDIYHAPIESVTKDQRRVGKVQILGCMYQAGAKTLVNYAIKQGVKLTLEDAQNLVNIFRAKNYRFVRTWREFHDAAMDAVKTSQIRVVTSTSHPVMFSMEKIPNSVRMLTVSTPNGPKICYPEPFIEKDEKGRDQLGYIRYNKGTPSIKKIHGGVFFQNWIQRLARDQAMYGATNAYSAGFSVFLHVHDEVLSEHPDPNRIDDFETALLKPIPLLKNCPLKVETHVSARYEK
jgi:DNA polymerase bacteriophage-type